MYRTMSIFEFYIYLAAESNMSRRLEYNINSFFFHKQSCKYVGITNFARQAKVLARIS